MHSPFNQGLSLTSSELICYVKAISSNPYANLPRHAQIRLTYPGFEITNLMVFPSVLIDLQGIFKGLVFEPCWTALYIDRNGYLEHMHPFLALSTPSKVDLRNRKKYMLFKTVKRRDVMFGIMVSRYAYVLVVTISFLISQNHEEVSMFA